MGISFAESAAPAICPQNQLSAEKTLFGYIKPNIPELRVREKARYDAWYCGLCRRLGARYGTAARALLSFDCTFLALLAASVSGEDSPEDLLRCPFKPFGKKRAMLGSPSAALDFAADVCVILSEFKLSDDIADGKPLQIAAKLPLLCAFKKARLRRPEVYAAVKKHMRELASVEAPYRGFSPPQSRKERLSGGTAFSNAAFANAAFANAAFAGSSRQYFRGNAARCACVGARSPKGNPRAEGDRFFYRKVHLPLRCMGRSRKRQKAFAFQPVQYLRLHPR